MTTGTRQPIAARYLELLNSTPLRPIRSGADLDRAIRMVDSLLDLDQLVPDEQDYLEVLSGLIEKYEGDEEPLPSVSDADMLRHLIEAKDITQSQLAAETRIAESTISAILSGKRALSRLHIATLARFFHVNPAVFLSA